MNEQKFCQSCGMPLDKQEVVGTNADQSKNEDYCIYCFKDGEFTQDVTMDEMIEISRKHMSEIFANDSSYNEQKAVAKMQSFFPKLKRWRA
ncbi:zinc ribbon domain-containing protein [Enterococcus pseudoavium]|uniref:Zinc ribbon domain-containing protein n=1 Tax=Enterococcus pseudoavium TaxID=44007 RepID=A0AAE4L0P1_9ENTE|nr:zinc ribbon domain-containing protein [Enterococcus pseudoavium]MDT2735916.1 zinc ribbon domain-containing protein [Enterococcus pseudoavium]